MAILRIRCCCTVNVFYDLEKVMTNNADEKLSFVVRHERATYMQSSVVSGQVYVVLRKLICILFCTVYSSTSLY